MRHHLSALLLVGWLGLLAGCGGVAASPTPTAPPASPPAATPLPPTVPTPLAPATVGPVVDAGGPTLTEPGSPDRTGPAGPVSVGPTSASRLPLLHYRGRTYSAAGLGGPRPADGPRHAGPVVGTTFARWQANGFVPAGTPIYSVAGVPTEQLLALKLGERLTVFRAEPRFSTLESTQVVLGTVTSFGPSRWTTPDGRRPPPDTMDDAGLYTPATIAVERLLQGRIPPSERAIEVRQDGGSDGPVAVTTSMGGLVPLAPGSRVILFLQPGQWYGGAPGRPPAGNYYWLYADGAYVVEGEQVRLAGEAGNAEQVPLAQFLAGVSEVFQGVTRLDPHGPAPTPAPPPTPEPTPTPRARVGQTINLVQVYQLDQVQVVRLDGPAVPEERAAVTEPARLRAIVAALDRPVMVLAEGPELAESAPDGKTPVTTIRFQFGDERDVVLEYHPRTGRLTVYEPPQPPVRVAAPPAFDQVLGLP